MRQLSLHNILCDVLLVQLLTGTSLGRSSGSNSGNSMTSFNYRAKRYGSYHSTKYFSYSGGIGYARYSRVYSTKKNKYKDYYFKMFDWFQTQEFVVYKNTPSDYISVCRNYEADANGTYLGIFTCPLPIYPDSHTYCCGVKNAEYCCKFWDVPLNVGASFIIGIMVTVILVTLAYIIVTLKKTEHMQNLTSKRKKSFFRKQHLIEMYEEMARRYRSWTRGSLSSSTSEDRAEF